MTADQCAQPRPTDIPPSSTPFPCPRSGHRTPLADDAATLKIGRRDLHYEHLIDSFAPLFHLRGFERTHTYRSDISRSVSKRRTFTFGTIFHDFPLGCARWPGFIASPIISKRAKESGRPPGNEHLFDLLLGLSGRESVPAALGGGAGEDGGIRDGNGFNVIIWRGGLKLAGMTQAADYGIGE
ncbi:hypothetical protein Zmor_019340 [Zophobas morio]|uniref:Uncharacterized protein n=1 Tax=Zophobas morio TaxID=2755281 RepID=A0AA38I1L8_9CUCU|nr:hypothetical protein Zmor_019340 [Zophobas morio]